MQTNTTAGCLIIVFQKSVIPATVFIFNFDIPLSDLRWVFDGHCRVLGLRDVGGVNEPGQACAAGILKDEGLHQVVAVVPVQEVVEDGVEAAVEKRQTLREVQCHKDGVLQPAA